MVNAVYHRSYEEREPIEVRISNEELAILSFPGPDRSIRLEDFQAGRAVSRRYRNRRIGEFLKELQMTEGRSTGIPKILKEMAANGSPAPLFETDDDRLSFVIRLPRHPLSLAPTVGGGGSHRGSHRGSRAPIALRGWRDVSAANPGRAWSEGRRALPDGVPQTGTSRKGD